MYRLSPLRMAGGASPSERITAAVRVKSIFATGYTAAGRAAGTEFADIVELVLFAAGSAAGTNLAGRRGFPRCAGQRRHKMVG